MECQAYLPISSSEMVSALITGDRACENIELINSMCHSIALREH